MTAANDATRVDVVTFGESMALFAADTPGDLAQVAHFTRRLAGADSNVAIGLSRLGLRVDWTSRVGNDAFGRFILASLAAEGIDCGHVVVDQARPTGLQIKSRTKDGSDPETEYFRHGSAASALAPDDLPAERMHHARHLHCTGIPAAISESAQALCHHAMDAMRAAGGTISFDPNLRPSLWPSTQAMREAINALAAKADWVLPGIDEGEILTGSRDPAAIAEHYLAAGSNEVVVKLGAEGAYWQSADAHTRVAGCPVAHVVDTVGAGDGFAVGFISARLEGLAPSVAVARANAIAARVIQYPGDSDGLPRRHELT
ncbi:sugar kinase [Salinisphaera hydrothermalis]|uniref:Ribokinase PfkB n=1 Tax=Salinisphaera hydrothermalis (strain C41B8) TaxID=1304275 RepID=A0A084IKE1_SALHC|nr:sugar kinase [Salinisphaera hydrothermalis]KEZ77175.1 ribokinase PfkB [Salinisphaera hydrothermalis C41B8]